MVFLWTGLRCFIYKACAELLLAHSKTPGVKTLLAAEGSCMARAETARMCSQAVFTLHQCLGGARSVESQTTVSIPFSIFTATVRHVGDFLMPNADA